jgi:CMP-N,N'-diacetyllegionaminic acid synthase
MSQTIALIPARSGSKGLPHKNIKLLGNHPLIAWSIIAATKANDIDRVIVSTDSEEYATIAKKYGADVPFLRPPEISGDRSTDYDFIIHALNWLRDFDEEPSLIVHLRPTTPFRSPLVIDKAINIFRKNNKATALRSAHEMSESAYKTFEISEDGRFKRVGSVEFNLDAANNARQQFPSTYMANGYVDVLSTSFIRDNKIIHGDWVAPFLTTLAQEVDNEDDFMLLEYELSRNPEIYKLLFN